MSVFIKGVTLGRLITIEGKFYTQEYLGNTYLIRGKKNMGWMGREVVVDLGNLGRGEYDQIYCMSFFKFFLKRLSSESPQ